MKFVILGATGHVGGYAVQAALDRGHEVKALVRNPGKMKIAHEKLEVKKADIFSEDVLADEIAGTDAILSCLGASFSPFSRQPVTFYTDTAKVAAAAMRRSGVSRIVVLSSMQLKDDGSQSFVYKRIIMSLFGNAMRNMEAMDDYFRESCSDLDHTSVKLPWCRHWPGTDKPMKTHEGERVPGSGACAFTSYVDVAKFMVANLLENGEWKKKAVALCT